jgi:pyrimidine-nucleoside phosphorylase
MASLELGAGRRTKDDKIDYKAGIVIHKKTGDPVKKGDLICELYSDSKTKLKTAEEMLINSFQFSKAKPKKIKLIRKIIY